MTALFKPVFSPNLLTRRQIVLETEIDGRLLTAHSRHAMIDYPQGAV